MTRRVLAAGVLFLGMCGACSRRHEVVIDEIAKDATPKPIVVRAVEPPKPEPIQLGEPPRLKEDPR